MSKMRDSGTVKTQYETDEKLRIRMSLHAKYSTNPEGFGNWVFRQFTLRAGYSVLEVGCGTGELWHDHLSTMEQCDRVVLSDISPGMLDSARQKLGVHPNLDFLVMDVSAIPFPDESFDCVIANHMLYHVPDLEGALRQLHRVLKSGGKLYSSTFGENGLTRYIDGVLREHGISTRIDNSFTLQNGAEKLGAVFSSVERADYPDSLRILEARDLAQYILSMSSLVGENLPSLSDLERTIENSKAAEGVVTIPKEAGVFISTK